jgi:hypothetical protein
MHHEVNIWRKERFGCRTHGLAPTQALEHTAIWSGVRHKVAIADRGYKRVAIDGVKIYHLACAVASRVDYRR